MLEALQVGAVTFPPTVGYIQLPVVTTPVATLENTVALSPGSSSQSAPQNSRVSLVEATAQTATVNANIRYFMKTGQVVPTSVHFFLLWDAQNSRWVVSDTK